MLAAPMEILFASPLIERSDYMKRKLVDVYVPAMTVAQLLRLCTEEEREQLESIIQKYYLKEA